MSEWQAKWEAAKLELQQTYDELRLKAHLGKKEAQDELAELQVKYGPLLARLESKKDELEDRAEDIGDQLEDKWEEVADELKARFERLRQKFD